MCGIAGVVEFEGPGPLRTDLERMVSVLARRGPDGSGCLSMGVCGLAHTRLSVIDPYGSAQPMQCKESGIAITYNGELYNYQELRDELVAQGVRMRTNGDTEVVLRLIERYWERAFERFRGMFAVAAWDARHRRLLMARDSIGEKPLYYALPDEQKVVFGSEPKAILAEGSISGGIRRSALRQALRFRAVYGTETLYDGIHQVEPGTSIECSAAGIRCNRYFDLVSAVQNARSAWSGAQDRELVEEGRRLLTNSIRERLVADVPVGLFLSGGLDSSLLAALMVEAAEGVPVRSYSVGFEGDKHSELPHARQVADHLQTVHCDVEVGAGAYIERLAELTDCRDGPVSEPADVAIACMSRIAKQSVKVVLTGEGADEVFAGYPKHGFAALPTFGCKLMRVIGSDRVAGAARVVGLSRRRAMIAARALVAPSESERLARWFSYTPMSQLQQFLPDLGWSDAIWEETTQCQRSALGRVSEWDALSRMQAVDCLSWLPCNLLERGDRMTMAEGLESRPPFLDPSLAAFGIALRSRLKRRGLTGKWILRQLGADLLPREIINRRKWGFRVPLESWFRADLRDLLHDTLSDPKGLCGTFGDQRAVGVILKQHDSGEVNHDLLLWTLLTTDMWYQAATLGPQRSRQNIPLRSCA